jgi:hypothetical protein
MSIRCVRVFPVIRGSFVQASKNTIHESHEIRERAAHRSNSAGPNPNWRTTTRCTNFNSSMRFPLSMSMRCFRVFRVIRGSFVQASKNTKPRITRNTRTHRSPFRWQHKYCVLPRRCDKRARAISASPEGDAHHGQIGCRCHRRLHINVHFELSGVCWTLRGRGTGLTHSSQGYISHRTDGSQCRLLRSSSLLLSRA